MTEILGERFELGELIGQGGMGRVFRAVDRRGGPPVALKLLRQGEVEPHEAQRFVREAQVLAGLRHPGIVGYVAHGLSDAGAPWLAMEWLEGEVLDQRMEGDRLLITARVNDVLVGRLRRAGAEVTDGVTGSVA